MYVLLQSACFLQQTYLSGKPLCRYYLVKHELFEVGMVLLEKTADTTQVLSLCVTHDCDFEFMKV